jgi:hypothetical protein
MTAVGPRFTSGAGSARRAVIRRCPVEVTHLRMTTARPNGDDPTTVIQM